MKFEPSPNAFTIPVRVYYEDTDAGGVVYYANYLRFFERCRTEWMRFAGHDQSALASEAGIGFVARKASCEYLRPALQQSNVTFVQLTMLVMRTTIFCRASGGLARPERRAAVRGRFWPAAKCGEPDWI